jgi:hypothetical protein
MNDQGVRDTISMVFRDRGWVATASWITEDGFPNASLCEYYGIWPDDWSSYMRSSIQLEALEGAVYAHSVGDLKISSNDLRTAIEDFTRARGRPSSDDLFLSELLAPVPADLPPMPSPERVMKAPFTLWGTPPTSATWYAANGDPLRAHAAAVTKIKELTAYAFRKTTKWTLGPLVVTAPFVTRSDFVGRRLERVRSLNLLLPDAASQQYVLGLRELAREIPGDYRSDITRRMRRFPTALEITKSLEAATVMRVLPQEAIDAFTDADRDIIRANIMATAKSPASVPRDLEQAFAPRNIHPYVHKTIEQRVAGWCSARAARYESSLARGELVHAIRAADVEPHAKHVAAILVDRILQDSYDDDDRARLNALRLLLTERQQQFVDNCEACARILPRGGRA